MLGEPSAPSTRQAESGRGLGAPRAGRAEPGAAGGGQGRRGGAGVGAAGRAAASS